MSARLSAGSCLEDTQAIPLDLRLQTLLFHRFRDKIHLPPQQLTEMAFHRGQTEQVDPGVRVQFGGKVHVAARGVLPTSYRPEEREMTNTG